LCAILLVNFARGIAATDAATAGVEFRLYSSFVATILFVFFARLQLDLDRVYNQILLLGWGIVLLSAVRLVFGLNSFIAKQSDPYWADPRTLNAAAALMLGQAMLIALNRMFSAVGARRRWRNGFSALIFAASILISDQQTAASAALAGAAIIFLASPRSQRGLAAAVGVVVSIVASIAVFAAWVASDGNLDSYLFSHGDTYEWRLEQWRDYFDLYMSAGIVDQMIGYPIGVVRAAGMEADSVLQFGAHSEYVGLLLASGAIGELLFVLALLLALTKGVFLLAGADEARSNQLRLAVAVLASLAVYCYAYSLPGEQGLLLAMAVQTIARRETAQARNALNRGELS
jgi:hypothetical protein